MDVAASSTEYVHVGVVASIGGTPITLAAPPKLAFLPIGSASNPVTEDWLTGEWNGTWARLLVGPNGGAITLDPGRYSVWITVAAGLETPVYRAGELTFY